MEMMKHIYRETPSQTAGPYVHIGCTPNFCGIEGVYAEDLGSNMLFENTKGERITVRGIVFDGTGAPVKDALVEIWQADANGIYDGNEGNDPAFCGFGRCPADQDTGEFLFETVKPGPTNFTDGRKQAPHITFWIVARGINIGLHTRMYFEDEDNSADPVLGRIELFERVKTLIGRKTGEHEYTFDIHLQGDGETVFFDI